MSASVYAPSSQTKLCAAAFDQSLTNASNSCSGLQSGICYGAAPATIRSSAGQALAFSSPTDRVKSTDVQSLYTQYDGTTQAGIIIASLAAGATNDQPITLLLFGDAVLAMSTDNSEAASFQMSTSPNTLDFCNSSMPSFIALMTKNVLTSIHINGAVIEFTSAVVLHIGNNNQLNLGVICGNARVGGVNVPYGRSISTTVDPDTMAVTEGWSASARISTETMSALGNCFSLPALMFDILSVNAVPTSTSNCTPNPDWPVYVVRSGDTLSAIGQRIHIPYPQIMRTNCLDSTVLQIGQRLRVPVDQTPWDSSANTIFSAEGSGTSSGTGSAQPTGGGCNPLTEQAVSAMELAVNK